MTLDRYGITKIHETLTNGTVWYSKWDKTRVLASNDHDPYDARTLVTCGSAVEQRLQIGNGIATWTTGNSPRLYIKGPWLNTEQTIYVKIPSGSDTSSIQLRGRSNHHGADKLPYTDMGINPVSGSDSISCGFGGYVVKWGEDPGDNECSIELEALHGIYKRHIVDAVFVIPTDQYVGYKMITRTDGSDVVVEGWNNTSEQDLQNGWTKTIEFTFDGTNAPISEATLGDEEGLAVQAWCANRGDNIGANINDNQVWLTPTTWNWFRVNDADNVSFKYYSVREIDV